MQNIESQVLYLTLALTPPFLFVFGGFFCFLKHLLRLKINILSSIYPEINFPTEPVMKINNLSGPKVPGPPQNQMVVPLQAFLRSMYPVDREHMTDCCYTCNIIIITPFPLHKEGKQRMVCKYNNMNFTIPRILFISSWYSFKSPLN